MNKMRTAIFCLILLSLFSINAYAAPQLSVSKATLQFNNVSPGQRTSKKLTLTNTGDEPLEIAKIRTSCSCIQAKCPLQLINPGKSISINVSFNSKGKSTGQGYYQILIYSSDSQEKITRIPVLTNIEAMARGLKISPETLDFGKIVISNSIPVLNITISNTGSKSFQLLEIRPGTGVDVPSVPADIVTPGDRVTIPVTLHSWVREGVFTSNLKIRTSDPSIPSFHCTIHGIIRK